MEGRRTERKRVNGVKKSGKDEKKKEKRKARPSACPATEGEK